MVALSSLLLAGTFLTAASAAGNVIPKGEGVGSDGFFYTVWDQNMKQTFTNQAGGAFDLTWDGDGDVVAGKGWRTGSDRNITYSGSYTTDGMSFLMIYGWFKNPLVEYYIMENWDQSSNPALDQGMEKITTLNTDGSDYDVFKKVQTCWPSIEGQCTTFDQYRSVRRANRTGGTVNMGAHFAAWKAKGLQLNDWHYQVVAVEGMQQNSNGTASIKVEKENLNTPAVASSASSANAPPVSTPSAPVLIPESSAPPAPAPPVPSSSIVQESSSADTVPDAPTSVQQAPTIAAPSPTPAPAPSSSSVSRADTSTRHKHGGHRHKNRKSRLAPAASSQFAAAADGAPTVTEQAVATTVTWVTTYVTVSA